MGPSAFTDGNRPEARSSRVRAGCFNGAVGVHRRKRYPLLGPARPVGEASMGPSAFTDGNQCGHRFSTEERQIASMGPSAFTDGNDELVAAAGTVTVELQWGRRRSPTETDMENT